MPDTNFAPQNAAGQAPTDKPIQRGCAVVLSMHRSGTSGLTRLISMMGAALPRTLMAAGNDNPTGFWESDALANLHDAFLADVGSTWNDWSGIRLGQIDDRIVEKHLNALVTGYAEEFGASPLTVLKDPRICRFYWLWEKAFAQLGIDAYPVLTLRNPLEVANSLSARNDFETVHGLLLWCRHMLEAERATRGRQRAWVDFADLLEKPQDCLQQVYNMLQTAWPTIRTPDLQATLEFLNSELRHHQRTLEHLALQDDVPFAPLKIFKALKDLSVNDGDALIFDHLDRLFEQFETISAPAARFWRRAQEARSRVEVLSAELQAATGLLSDRAVMQEHVTTSVTELGDRTYMALTTTIEPVTKAQIALGKELEALRRTHEQSSEAVFAVGRTIDSSLHSLQDQLTRLQQIAFEQRQELVSLSNHNGALQAQLAAERDLASRLRQDLLIAKAHLQPLVEGYDQNATQPHTYANGAGEDALIDVAGLAERVRAQYETLQRDNVTMQTKFDEISSRLANLLLHQDDKEEYM